MENAGAYNGFAARGGGRGGPPNKLENSPITQKEPENDAVTDRNYTKMHIK